MYRVNFYKFVGNLYPHISANFCTFTSIFHQMVLIFPWVPIVFTVSSFKYWMQMFREQGLGEKAIISSYNLYKGERWALLTKCAGESTTLAQPFWVNQAVGLGDLSQRLHAQFVIVRHLSHWYVLPSFKTMSVKRPLLYILTNLCQMACLFSGWIDLLKRRVLVEKLTPFDEILR